MVEQYQSDIIEYLKVFSWYPTKIIFNQKSNTCLVQVESLLQPDFKDWELFKLREGRLIPSWSPEFMSLQ